MVRCILLAEIWAHSDYLDFMSIRKIPMKEQPYLNADDSMNVADDERPEDPQVEVLTNKIRETLLTDRGIHDQVWPPFFSLGEYDINSCTL